MFRACSARIDFKTLQGFELIASRRASSKSDAADYAAELRAVSGAGIDPGLNVERPVQHRSELVGKLLVDIPSAALADENAAVERARLGKWSIFPNAKPDRVRPAASEQHDAEPGRNGVVKLCMLGLSNTCSYSRPAARSVFTASL